MSITKFNNVQLKQSCKLLDDQLKTSSGNTLTFPSAGGTVLLKSAIPSGAPTICTQDYHVDYSTTANASPVQDYVSIDWRWLQVGSKKIVFGDFRYFNGRQASTSETTIAPEGTFSAMPLPYVGVQIRSMGVRGSSSQYVPSTGYILTNDNTNTKCYEPFVVNLRQNGSIVAPSGIPLGFFYTTFSYTT